MPDATARNTSDIPAEKKLDELYDLVEGIEIAMLTTRSAGGQLVSRAMATQHREPGADFWFVTNVESDKLDDLAANAQVNLAYYNMKTREWVSVSGEAAVSQDREMIRTLYRPDWKAWFGDEGGARDGGPEDPRLALILVTAQSAVYSKSNKPRVLALFAVAKAIATGDTPQVADLRSLSEDELHPG